MGNTKHTNPYSGEVTVHAKKTEKRTECGKDISINSDHWQNTLLSVTCKTCKK